MKPYYQDNAVTIYHGDARLLLSRVAADVLITDPPYGIAYESGWKPEAIQGDLDHAARDRVLELWGERPGLVFGSWKQPPRKARLALVWDKGDWPGMGNLSDPWGPSFEMIYVLGHGFIGDRIGSILRDPRRPGADRAHPCEKPTGLLRGLVIACPEPWVILDPFAGSGTTLRAAKDMGRKAVGIEIEEKYAEMAARRCSQEVLL